MRVTIKRERVLTNQHPDYQYFQKSFVAMKEISHAFVLAILPT